MLGYLNDKERVPYNLRPCGLDSVGGIGCAVRFSTHIAKLKSDIDQNEIVAVPGSCQNCRKVGFLGSAFIRLQYVLISVVSSIQIGKEKNSDWNLLSLELWLER